MKRRVVVTGMGCVTPLGHSVDEMWQRLLRRRIGRWLHHAFRRQQISDQDFRRSEKLGYRRRRRRPPSLEIPRPAHPLCRRRRQAGDATTRALPTSKFDPTRFGVYLGSGEGQQDFFSFSQMMAQALEGETLDVAAFTREGLETLHPMAELEQEPHMPAAHLASMFNAQGPNANCLTACAASSQAIGEAAELIRRGEADVMLSGGTHSMIHPFGVTGFNLLTALSTRNDEPTKSLAAVRPRPRRLRARRRGGDARAGRTRSRQASAARPSTAKSSAYGSTADAFRITDTHPEGRGATSCIRLALEDAGLNPTDIHYINAHGTSTDVNDKVESLAIKTVFGEHAYKMPVSSTKSMMGHLIAAAGATELIICLLAIRDGVLPPTINYETPDPECDLDYIPNTAREARCDVALSNSFGFGGQNISLIVGRLRN